MSINPIFLEPDVTHDVATEPTYCAYGHEWTPENTIWRPGHSNSPTCRKCRNRRANDNHKANR